MKVRSLSAALAGLLVLAACSESPTPTQPEASKAPVMSVAGSSGQTHVMGLRGLAPAPTGQVSGQANGINYHGGPILPVTNVAAMYWGTATIYNGGPTPGTKGAGSSDGSLVGYFLSNLGGSSYFNINTTYTDLVGGGHTVGNVVNYTQYWADNVNVPPSNGTTVTDATIQAEIIRGFTTGNLSYDPATIYAVFTAGNTNLGGGFGSQYCAYHGNFMWNGNLVIYASMPYVQQYVSGCSNGTAPPNGDAAADRLINVLAHEIEESTTDYQLNAWYDSFGQENADKCAWNFGTTYNNGTGVANMKIGAKDFLIQGNWLNANGGSCEWGFGGGGNNQPPVAAFTYSCDASLNCLFDGTGSSDPDGSIASYSWTLTGGKQVSSGSTFSHTFPGSQTFDLTLTVTDNQGATNSVTHTVTVMSSGGNQPPTASFTYSCNASHACTFDGSGSTDDVGITNYSWTFNGKAIASGVSFSHTFPNARSFNLTLTVTDGGGLTDSQTQTINVP